MENTEKAKHQQVPNDNHSIHEFEIVLKRSGYFRFYLGLGLILLTFILGLWSNSWSTFITLAVLNGFIFYWFSKKQKTHPVLKYSGHWYWVENATKEPFELLSSSWVFPHAILLYVKFENSHKHLTVWRDVNRDKNYLQLCRMVAKCRVNSEREE